MSSTTERPASFVTDEWLLSTLLALAVATLVYWVLSSPTLTEVSVFAVAFGVVYGAVDYLLFRRRSRPR